MKARIIKEQKQKTKHFTEIEVNAVQNHYEIHAKGHNDPKICAAISFALITLAQALEFQSQEGKIKSFEADLHPGDSKIKFELPEIEKDNSETVSEARVILNTIVDGLIMLQQANSRKIILTGNVFGGTAEEQHKRYIEDMRKREKDVLAYMAKNNSTARKRAETQEKYKAFKKNHPGHGTDDTVIENGLEELMKEI